MSSHSAFVALRHVRKVYRTGSVDIEAARDISFDVERGELAVILGPSGAGKTTVLNLLGGMDTCTGGDITVAGQCLTGLSPAELSRYRRSAIGFVFQFYNLIPNLTALENVELATQLCRDAFDPETVLRQVGLGDRLDSFPAQLSGGEQQRVAIARALAKNPDLMLCDEPTGALDEQTGERILMLLQETCRTTGCTVIIITHNQAIVPIADRVIRMKDGRIDRIDRNPDPVPASDIHW